MNKNNIINFIKYILFTGILYFIIQNISKLSLANIGEFEILLIIVIITVGLYSYECIIEKFFNNKQENFTDNDQDDPIKLQKVNDPYIISTESLKNSLSSNSKSKLSINTKSIPEYEIKINKSDEEIPVPSESCDSDESYSSLNDTDVQEPKNVVKLGMKNSQYNSGLVEPINYRIKKSDNNIKPEPSDPAGTFNEGQFLILDKTNHEDLNDMDNRIYDESDINEQPKNILKITSAFIKGTTDIEKVIIDPETGDEVKLNLSCANKYIQTNPKTNKKFVYIEDENNEDVKQIYINDSIEEESVKSTLTTLDKLNNIRNNKRKERKALKNKNKLEILPELKNSNKETFISDDLLVNDESSKEILSCGEEVLKVKKELLTKIKKLKSQLKQKNIPVDKTSRTLPFIEKKNIKIIVKDLLNSNILDESDVKDINEYVETTDEPLSLVIESLERLKKSQGYKSNSNNDLRYDELPVNKTKSIGDQISTEWDNEYTLLNTDKWTVPQYRPPVCVKTNNVDPLPTNEPGYPLALKEWDNSRIISNQYINKKWAMDQIDSGNK